MLKPSTAPEPLFRRRRDFKESVLGEKRAFRHRLGGRTPAWYRALRTPTAPAPLRPLRPAPVLPPPPGAGRGPLPAAGPPTGATRSPPDGVPRPRGVPGGPGGVSLPRPPLTRGRRSLRPARRAAVSAQLPPSASARVTGRFRSPALSPCSARAPGMLCAPSGACWGA